MKNEVIEKRNYILVLEDRRDISFYYKKFLLELLGPKSRYELFFFDNNNEAELFVSENREYIQGYIQDIHRTDDVGSFEGVDFLNNVISKMTPWARCLIVSGTPHVGVIVDIFTNHYDRIKFESKGNVSFREILQKHLPWLLEKHSTQILESNDFNSIYPIVQLIEKPWNEICFEICRDNKLLHTIPPDVFECLVAEVFKKGC